MECLVGCIAGISIGCILGMVPLLFFEDEFTREMKEVRDMYH